MTVQVATLQSEWRCVWGEKCSRLFVSAECRLKKTLTPLTHSLLRHRNQSGKRSGVWRPYGAQKYSRSIVAPTECDSATATAAAVAAAVARKVTPSTRVCTGGGSEQKTERAKKKLILRVEPEQLLQCCSHAKVISEWHMRSIFTNNTFPLRNNVKFDVCVFVWVIWGFLVIYHRATMSHSRDGRFRKTVSAVWELFCRILFPRVDIPCDKPSGLQANLIWSAKQKSARLHYPSLCKWIRFFFVMTWSEWERGKKEKGPEGVNADCDNLYRHSTTRNH